MLGTVVDGADPRVVLVHGFTQTTRSWEAVARRLADRYEVVRVDLPGHGASADIRLDFEDAAVALGEAGGNAAYVGYSMGGRLCLRLALDRPDLVRALVLVGASPGIVDPVARDGRRADDERLAATIEADGVDAFLETWLAGPLFATLPRQMAGLNDRRVNTAAGLAAALRSLGPGAQEPLWNRLVDLRVPTLVMAGARDPKFGALATEMAGAIGPSARAVFVSGAGHAANLEQPDAFIAPVEQFLEHHVAR